MSTRHQANRKSLLSSTGKAPRKADMAFIFQGGRCFQAGAGHRVGYIRQITNRHIRQAYIGPEGNGLLCAISLLYLQYKIARSFKSKPIVIGNSNS